MGARGAANKIEGIITEYICVLCGGVWSSADYDWGGSVDDRCGSVVRRCDWSCPQCGGVVVEYARHASHGGQGEQTLAPTNA